MKENTRPCRWWSVLGFALGLAALILVFFKIQEPRGAGRAAAPARQTAEAAARPLPAAATIVSLEPSIAPAITREVHPQATSKPFKTKTEALPGSTKFVRRLVAGSRARELKATLQSPIDDADLQGFKSWCFKSMLSADRVALARISSKGARATPLEQALQVLTEPPCDLETVKLANPEAEDDPLGKRFLVRVWTLDGRYAQAEIDTAVRNLRHVAEVTGTSLAAGFDVLVTPKKGKEVFPWQQDYSWAAGIFFRSDRYCVVNSTLAPAFRVVVMRHELMHALTWQALSQEISRMVREGLAEYLRLCRPGDVGLAVPLVRLADNLALLQLWIDALSARGARIDSLDPARLVTLRPKEFYALRKFSYLVAQAAMAYVGHEVIEQAFAEKTEKPIVEAVARIDWLAFLEFVKTNAASGHAARAVVVEDAPGDAGLPDDPADVSRHFRSVLESLGAKVEEGAELDPEELGVVPDEQLSGEHELLRVVEALLRSSEEHAGSPGAGPILLADMSSALMRTCRPLTTSPAYALIFQGSRIPPGNGLTFLSRAIDAFRPGGERSAIVLAALTAAPEPRSGVTSDQASEYTAGAAAAWLASQGRDPLDLVIFVSGFDEPLRRQIRAEWRSAAYTDENVQAELEERYRRAFAAENLRIRRALIVDLFHGRSDALPLARGIAAAVSTPGEAVYWDPAAPPRSTAPARSTAPPSNRRAKPGDE